MIKRILTLAVLAAACSFAGAGNAQAGLLDGLWGHHGCGCAVPACGCEVPHAPACACEAHAAPTCGCEAAHACAPACCDTCCRRPWFGWLRGLLCCKKRCCDSCCEPSCACEPTCAAQPTCECNH